MLLLLSSSSPANSTYATAEGQILYKVTKPFIGTATMRKAVRTVQGVWNGTYELQRLNDKPILVTCPDGSVEVQVVMKRAMVRLIRFDTNVVSLIGAGLDLGGMKGTSHCLRKSNLMHFKNPHFGTTVLRYLWKFFFAE